MVANPPPSDTQNTAPVYSLGRHLKRLYGRRLRRVMLDLGLTCPNRDGASGFGGCIYCDLSGSGTGAERKGLPLLEQWESELKRVRRVNTDDPAAILYFQSYSNTYPDLAPLQEGLKIASQWSTIAPIVNIGTRPDCFSEEAAELLAKSRSHFDEVWVEFGLETAQDAVQKRIGRHDTLEHFHRACELAHQHGLGIIAHCMSGLPGDSDESLLEQVAEIRKARAHGVKFHQLMVLKKTLLAHQFLNGQDDIHILKHQDYIDRVADALEHLPADVVVHRLVAESPIEERLAPLDWPSRQAVHSAIENELIRRGTRQGSAL